MIDAVAAIPGVTAVGAVGRPPLAAAGFLSYIFARDATDFRATNALVSAQRFQISPEYLSASRTRLIAGRAFSRHDDEHAPRVAILNAEAARRLAGSADAAPGTEFRLRDRTVIHIVGVVEDGKYQNLAEDAQPAVFMPLQQMPVSETWLIVRADGDPGPLGAAIRAAIRNLDPGLPLYVEPWARQLDFAMFPSRMATIALAIMGAIGVLLAVTGVFGLSAYSVSKRVKELGIRIALGARRADIVRIALGRPFRLLALGGTAGVGFGVLASRVLAAIVYQATPRDPVVLAGVVLVLVVLGLAATWVPARRALSADPLRLLRQE
jgi:hypothetical protein